MEQVRRVARAFARKNWHFEAVPGDSLVPVLDETAWNKLSCLKMCGSVQNQAFGASHVVCVDGQPFGLSNKLANKAGSQPASSQSEQD